MIFKGDSSYRTQIILSMALVLGKVLMLQKARNLELFQPLLWFSVKASFPMKKWNKNCSPLEVTKQTHNLACLDFLFCSKVHFPQCVPGGWPAAQKPQSEQSQSGSPRLFKGGHEEGEEYCMYSMSVFTPVAHLVFLIEMPHDIIKCILSNFITCDFLISSQNHSTTLLPECCHRLQIRYTL